MRTLSVLSLIIVMAGCTQGSDSRMEDYAHIPVSYPDTEEIPVTDVYHESEVVDNYRWLEDDMSDETADWVQSQNEVTFGYLEQIPFREAIRSRLEQLWNYEKFSAPFQEGDYTYFYKNDGLQNQFVLLRQKGDGEPTVFLDPNTFSDDGTTSLAGISFTEDGSMAAYSISEGGSDWRKIIVIDTESMAVVEDTLVDIKFSGIAWRGNEGFYYS